MQSFELTNLYTLRNTLRLKAPLVFLRGGGAPYDLVAQGDPRTYADLQQPESLAVLARTIDGLGPDKSLVIPRNADGTLRARRRRASCAMPTPSVCSCTPTPSGRRTRFLPADYRIGSDPTDHGRAVDEQVRFLQTGIDGLFTDQPDIGVAARGAFLGQR